MQVLNFYHNLTIYHDYDMLFNPQNNVMIMKMILAELSRKYKKNELNIHILSALPNNQNLFHAH